MAPINPAQKVGQEKKKKTPHQNRTEVVRIKTRNELSASQKKNFKECFNTDKSRLDKRQAQHSRSPNFLLILEDNVNSAECTSGKMMVYGKGSIAQQFFYVGIKFSKDDFYLHKRATDFLEDRQKVEDVLFSQRDQAEIKEVLKE